MLSSRQKMLLRKLLEGSQYVTIEFLSKWQNVSERTIRYDLDAIDSAIREVGASLSRAPGKGVCLHIGEKKQSNRGTIKMSYMKQYHATIQRVLERILNEQESILKEVAQVMTDALAEGNSLYIFGASHAGIVAEDAFYRAGGFALFNPIFSPALMLNVEPITLTSKMERLEGYGQILLESKPVKGGDVLFIHSVSGRNPVAIDIAMAAKEKGMKVISLTNVTYSKSVSSRHSTGKRLFEVSDLVIDNFGEPGDAVVSIHSLTQKVGPTSTIIGSFVIHSIVLNMVELLEAANQEVPIFRSANLDGGDEYNSEMMDKYKSQIHYL